MPMWRQTKLVLILATMLPVINVCFSQNIEGLGAQKPFKITGTLAANVMVFNAEGRPRQS